MYEHLAVQPFESVTVAVYVPADKPLFEAVVFPLLHKYVYGAVPPLATTAAEPVDAPLHVTFVPLQLATNNVGCVTVYEQVAVHPFASVTVAVYVPADKLLFDEVVLPLLQR